MGTIQRPVKAGGNQEYAAEKAAGYITIRSAELDADFDTIVTAWNAGLLPYPAGSIPGTALANGSVTDPKIVSVAYAKVTGTPTIPTTLPPSGSAGGSLAGSYPNPTIAPLAVTNAAVNDVAWGKITGAPTSLPPSGTASGDLTGTYPAPTLNPISRFPLSLGSGTINSSATIVPGQSGGYITVNATSGPVNVTLPTGEALGYSFWIVKVDSSANAVNLQSSVGGENIGVAGSTPGGGATVSWTKQYAGYFVTRTLGTGRTAWTALAFGAAPLP